MCTWNLLVVRKKSIWKLWILTSLIRCRCVASKMKFSSFFLQRCNGCTWRVVPITYMALVLELIFAIMLGGPSTDSSCRKCAIEYKPGKHQLMRLTLRLGLTHTGKLKGRGCHWVQLPAPFLAVFPCGGVALCKYNTSNWWNVRKPRLDSYMQGEIYMKLEIN